jgi:LytS/YehU family sensor histidine kinase
VRERLHTLHGDQASLSLSPGEPRGTVVTVRLPLAEAPSATTPSIML